MTDLAETIRSIPEERYFSISDVRINLIFVLAYAAALLAGIPYWRYLGLTG